MNPNATNVRMSAWLERAWLSQYLERTLDDAETAWFEAYVLDKPELLHAIEMDTDLRDGLAAVANHGLARDQRAVTSARPRGPRVATPLALAATVVLGIGLGAVMQRTMFSGTDADVVANPGRVVYDTLRGEASAPTYEPSAVRSEYLLIEVALPADATGIELRVGNEPPRPLRLSADSFASFLITRERAREVRNATIHYTTGTDQFDKPIVLPVP